MSSEALLAGNAAALTRELAWLGACIELRLGAGLSGPLPEPPDSSPEESPYGDVVERLRLSAAERLVLALALTPHVRPELLDPLFAEREQSRRGRAAFGGIQGRSHGGFLPTAETALFLLGGNDLRARFEAQALLEPGSRLGRTGLVEVEDAPSGEPFSAGLLSITETAIGLFTTGTPRRPEFGREFPARRLTSEMTWDELVLAPTTLEQLRELEAWTRFRGQLARTAPLASRLRGGYRAIFCGPPGTGKTLATTLLGERVGRDVYRVSLSAVVSKYIGETARNLERLFRTAERLDCILFFDEADAIFGKRAQVSDARDRYANQEISYLLQRVEEFSGVMILATNFEANIDDAFMRRFHAVVHFPLPGATERLRLWRESMPLEQRLERDVDLAALAHEYPLTGAGIVNVVQYATLMALASTGSIKRTDLLTGIRRELQKAGKTP